MTLDDFRTDFIESAYAAAEAEGEFVESALVLEACKRLEEAEVITTITQCFHQGTGNRKKNLRVDGYCVDDVDDTYTLVVGEFRKTVQAESLTQLDLSRLSNLAAAFIEDALSGYLIQALEKSTPAYGLAHDLNSKRHDIAGFKILIVSDCILKIRTKSSYRSERSIGDVPVKLDIWDIARLHDLAESRGAPESIEIELAEFGSHELACLEASSDSKRCHSYLCAIPAETLVDIYDRYGSRLLEGNVRSFLSATGKINKAIRKTINTEPEMFFAYNNGISATASSVEIVKTNSGLELKRITNLQIVNGGQTTASLSLAKRKDAAMLNDIYVPMKLSVVQSQEAEELIPRIALCANSQNKVSDADFFSNHPFHVRMEEFSRRLWFPAALGALHDTHWFYERSRGQYMNAQSTLPVSERSKFLLKNPKSQLITKTDLAKVEMTWLQRPHIVSRGNQKNFVEFAKCISEKWPEHDADFSEEYFRAAIAKCIIFRHTEKLIGQQSWYQNGYRANIVTYSLAKLASMLDSRKHLRIINLKNICAKGVISTGLEKQLVSITRDVFDVIVHPINAYQNITEWCKNELCWSRVQERSIAVLPELEAELVDKDEAKSASKSARLVQHIDNGIKNQSSVVAAGADFWSALLDWGNHNRLLSGEEAGILKVASQIPSKIPSELQSARLVSIRDRLLDEGFDASGFV